MAVPLCTDITYSQEQTHDESEIHEEPRTNKTQKAVRACLRASRHGHVSAPYIFVTPLVQQINNHVAIIFTYIPVVVMK